MEYIVLYRGGSKQWASHVNPTLPYLCQFIFSLPSIPSPSSPPPHPQKLHIHPAGKSLLQPFFYRVKGWCSEKRNGGEEKERRLSNASIKRHLKARETLQIDWRDIQRKRRQRGRGKRTQNRKGGRDIRERGVRLSDCPTLPLCFPQVATSPQQHRDPLTTWYWCFI